MELPNHYGDRSMSSTYTNIVKRMYTTTYYIPSSPTEVRAYTPILPWKTKSERLNRQYYTRAYTIFFMELPNLNPYGDRGIPSTYTNITKRMYTTTYLYPLHLLK
jgi:hypothetical protein